MKILAALYCDNVVIAKAETMTDISDSIARAEDYIGKS